MEPKGSLPLFFLCEHFVTWYFLRLGIVSTSPNPQAEGLTLVGHPRLLIQYIHSYPPCLRPFLHPKSEDFTSARLWKYVRLVIAFCWYLFWLCHLQCCWGYLLRNIALAGLWVCYANVQRTQLSRVLLPSGLGDAQHRVQQGEHCCDPRTSTISDL